MSAILCLLLPSHYTLLGELPYALQKAVHYPYKIARDVKSNSVEACFLSNQLIQAFTQASSVHVALPYCVEQAAYASNPIDSRFALALFDFSPKLGWNQYQGQSTHLCVLTRYEIAETFDHEPWLGVGARLVHSSGREFLAWSIWLDYRAYIPYVIRDNPGISDEDLLKSEFEGSQRLPQAERLLERIEELGHLDSPLPLLVGGDWNTPSHLDWTRDSASVFKRRRDLDLPVSMLVESNDFSDVYRMLHPDPVHHPGITWSPMFRGTDEKEEGFDRIDRLYMHDFSRDWQLKPVSTTVFPLVWEDLSIPVPERKFPSDHSAVLLEMKFVEKPLGPGDPGYTTLEVAGWEVEATARKFLGDQVDVYFTLSKDGEKVASPRVWLIENEPAKVEVGDGQFVLRATVDAIPTDDLTRVTIRIETEEKGHITRLPEAVIDIR